MSTLESAFSQLPKPIQNKLDSMIRRVRRLLLVRGLCATLAVALACLLGIMVIDATVTLFTSTSRWALSLTGLGITTVACWWFLVRPLSRRYSLTQMARIIEVRHPELQERISTAVELLSSDDPESIKGSEELISAVVDSAVIDVEAVDPRSEFKPARTLKFMATAGAFTCVIALSLLIWPSQSWTLLQRAVAPFLDIGNAWADTLVVDPGDQRISEGDPITISLAAQHKKLKRAEIRRLLDDGTESVERLSLDETLDDGTRKFSITFPQVNESFSYRIRAGSALTRYYQIETVTPPVLEEVELEYDFPEYTELAPKTTKTETGEIRAVAFTKVTIKATPSKPVATAKLWLNEQKDLGEPEDIDGQLSWTLDLQPGMTGNWSIELTDEDAFSNSPVLYPLEVLPDKTPSILINQPIARELRLRPTERLDVIGTVIEDFGFSAASLLITPIGADRPQLIEIPLPQPTGAAETFLSSSVLDLGQLDLNSNQQRLSVQLQIQDSRPDEFDGPGIGLSEPFFITLDQNAKTLAEQAIEAKQKAIEEQLRKTKQELEKARNNMRQAEQELKRTDDVSERAMRPLKDFSKHTEEARKELDQVAASLNDSFLQDQADKAARIADEQITQAREKADLIPVTDEKSARIRDAQEARKQIEEAIKGVDEISQAMKAARDEFEMISQLNNLANEQQSLANKAQDMSEQARENADRLENNPRPFTENKLTEQQRQQMEEFRREQEKVQQELGQMLKDNAAALDEVLAEQQEQAEGLAKEADALASEQESLKKLNEEVTKLNKDQQNALKERLLEHLKLPEASLPSLGSLAEREETREALTEKIEQGDLQEALSEMEEQLSAEAKELQAEAEAMEQTLENLSQGSAESAAARAEQALRQGAQEAQQAANQLEQAEQLQDRAVEQGTTEPENLTQQAKAAMQRARNDQMISEQAFDRAAQAFAASAEAMGQTREGLDPSDADNQMADGEQMAEGFEEVTESSQSQSAQEAAQQSQEAADALQQLAENAMKQFGSQPPQDGLSQAEAPGDGSELGAEPDSTNLNESGLKTADADGDGVPPELQALGIDARDWAKFKEALTGGNAAGIETELPAEYRELVGRYFQVIAKEAGKEE